MITKEVLRYSSLMPVLSLKAIYIPSMMSTDPSIAKLINDITCHRPGLFLLSFNGKRTLNLSKLTSLRSGRA